MTCPKCGSNNVSVQMMSDVKLKDKHHGIIWWMLVGWWWILIKWIFFTVPALIIAIFGHKKQKVVTKNYTMCICQDCGNSWKK